VLVVHPALRAATVKELIALAKAGPGEINFASSGYGTPAHLAGSVQLDGGGEDDSRALQGRCAGARRSARRPSAAHVLDHAARVAHVKDGKLRALAVTSLKRSPRRRNCRQSMRSPCRDSRRTPGTAWWACGHARDPHHEAQPRDRRDSALARCGGTPFEPGRGTRGQHAGGIRRLYQVESVKWQGRQGIGREGGVRRAPVPLSQDRKNCSAPGGAALLRIPSSPTTS